MEYIVSPNEMKKSEYNAIEKRNVPPLELMERAALTVVEELRNNNMDLSKVLVVCGRGNNGADGLAIARLINADVFLLGDVSKSSSENIYQQNLCINKKIKFQTNIEGVSKYTTVIDAIFGIGLSKNVDEETSKIIDGINTANNVVSVDIPSGLSSYTGKIFGNAVKANYTITFGYKKIGLLLNSGIDYSGKVILKDIGLLDSDFENNLPQISSVTYSDLKKHLPKRPPHSNKGTFGKVLVIAGAKNMSGAAYFSSKAVLNTGAGLVKIFTVKENREILQTMLPEAIIETDKNKLKECIDWATVVAIGPGIGNSDYSSELLKTALAHSNKPTVIDADALNILSTNPAIINTIPKGKEIIITPHVGEMARLISKDISYTSENTLEIAKTFAKENNCVTILKDARTIVSDGKNTYINQSGNNGMATGGTGDILTGVISSLIAQGTTPLVASYVGVFLHGLAGDNAAKEKGVRSMIASDLLDSLIEILKNF